MVEAAQGARPSIRRETPVHQLALLAGSVAAAIFVVSQLPMVIKAYRTRNLSSYSFANIGLANLGNGLYTVYVVHVPIGPAWAVHGFNLTTAGVMLVLYLRHGSRSGASPGRPGVAAARGSRSVPGPGLDRVGRLAGRTGGRKAAQ